MTPEPRRQRRRRPARRRFVLLVAGVAAFALCVGIGAAALVSEMSQGEGQEPAYSVLAETASGACDRPYTDASPWNTPIGARPAYNPRSRAHVAALGATLSSDPTQYTYPVYEVSESTQLETVEVRGRFSDVTAGGRRLDIQKGGTVRLRIPSGARAAAGSDAQIILVDPSSGDEWGAWQLNRGAGGRWSIENGYHYNTKWDGVPPREEGGNPFGSRGAGVPYLTGLVRPCEIVRGRIDHALAFAYDDPTPRHVYPATKSDGHSRDPRDLPEGARLQLDPSLTRTDLEDLGCGGACLTIARALQRYGMYVIDHAGRPKVMLEYEDTAHWRGTLNSKTVGPIPMSAFRVLRDCGRVGTVGDDVIQGTARSDVVCARGGDDRVSGGGGDDVLHGEGGRDVLKGGSGRDLLQARDGRRDVVDGGPGRDRANVDRGLDRRLSVP